MSDDRLEQSKQWLETLLKLAGLPATVQVSSSETTLQDTDWLTINASHLTPEQIQALTGTHGAVLDSLQYLANTILNLGKEREQQGAITIELAGYRTGRQAQLQELAEQAAEQVRQTGEEYELKSLSSAERRQVHTFLKDCADLETYSRGQEPDRRLVVRLLSPGGAQDSDERWQDEQQD